MMRIRPPIRRPAARPAPAAGERPDWRDLGPRHGLHKPADHAPEPAERPSWRPPGVEPNPPSA